MLWCGCRITIQHSRIRCRCTRSSTRNWQREPHRCRASSSPRSRPSSGHRTRRVRRRWRRRTNCSRRVTPRSPTFRRRSPPHRPTRNPMTATTPNPTRATGSSISCYSKRAGHSTRTAIVNTKSPACRTRPAKASSTTCCGVPTVCRWLWWRPNAPRSRRRSGRSRPNCTPIASKNVSAEGLSSSIPTVTNIASGTTQAATRPARSTASTRPPNSNY